LKKEAIRRIPRFDFIQGKLIPAHEFLAITPRSALFVQSVVEIISAFPRMVFGKPHRLHRESQNGSMASGFADATKIRRVFERRFSLPNSAPIQVIGVSRTRWDLK